MITKARIFAASVAGLCICAALAIPTRAQEPLPAPPNAKVVSLNTKSGSFTEPSIAINPANRSQLAAAFQVNASVAYSGDAGEHWTLAQGTAPANYGTSGDVSVAYDSRGHAILCYIAFDKLGTPEYWAHNATRNGIFIRRSLDGGKTWERNAVAVDEQATRPVTPFEDKPNIVADDNPKSPNVGNLYVGWTEFSLTKTIILFSRSTDGGATWSKPLEISTHEGFPRDDNGAVEGFSGAVAPDGTLYAVWADGDFIVLTASHDGGKTFDPSRTILDVAPLYFKVENVERANGFPQIGIDPRSGRIFVTWSDYRNGDVDIFCARSSDQSATWSSAVRVNDDPMHNGADQFFQWLAVDPSDGSANVIFYDRRNDPNNNRPIVVLARSTDGEKTFRNYAWTTQSFDPRDDFIGDYTGIAAFNGRVYGVWTSRAGARQSPAATSGHQKSGKHSPGGLRSGHTVIDVGVADFSPGANSRK